MFTSPPRGEGAPAAPLSEAQSFSTFRCQVRRLGAIHQPTPCRPSPVRLSSAISPSIRRDPQSAKHPRHPYNSHRVNTNHSRPFRQTHKAAPPLWPYWLQPCGHTLPRCLSGLCSTAAALEKRPQPGLSRAPPVCVSAQRHPFSAPSWPIMSLNLEKQLTFVSSHWPVPSHLSPWNRVPESAWLHPARARLQASS